MKETQKVRTLHIKFGSLKGSSTENLRKGTYRITLCSPQKLDSQPQTPKRLARKLSQRLSKLFRSGYCCYSTSALCVVKMDLWTQYNEATSPSTLSKMLKLADQ
jgi:SET domain-containing protein